MKPTLFFPVLLAVSLIFAGEIPLYAQVSSPIVGFVKVGTAADADVVSTVPFHATPEFVGVLDSMAGDPDTSGTEAVLNVGGDPGWTVNQFDSHYVQMGSGANEGAWFPVQSNTAATLTVDLKGLGGNLTLRADDQILVIPDRTLDGILPPADQPDGQKAAGDLPPQRKMEVLLYEQGAGTDRAPSRVFFLAQSVWKENKRGFPEAGSEVIAPDAVLVIRSKSDAETPYVLMHGTVSESDHTIWLKTLATGPQDNVVSPRRPVPMKVSELGLNDDPPFVVSTDTAAENRKDELLVWDNTSTEKNREPTAVYFRVTGTGWVKDVAGFPAGGDDEIPPDAVIIVRKAQGDGNPVIWRNAPSWIAP